MKKSAKKVWSLILAGMMAASVLTGCGSKSADTKAEATEAPKAENDQAGEAKEGEGQAAEGEKKTLRVAMECAYAPYNWSQPAMSMPMDMML